MSGMGMGVLKQVKNDSFRLVFHAQMPKLRKTKSFDKSQSSMLFNGPDNK